jgi:hypothetical protein
MPALPVAEFIGTADVGDIIPTEHIQETVEGFNLPRNIGPLVASVVAGRGYIPHVFARWDEPTFPDPVRAGGETDDLPRMDMSTSSSPVTPVLKGFQLLVPDEPIESQGVAPGQGIPIGALEHAVLKIEEFVDIDILDTAQAATNTIGSAVIAPSFAHWRAGLFPFRDLENNGQVVFVGSNFFTAGMQDEFTTAVSQFSAAIPNEMLFADKTQFRGSIMAVDFWQSGNVATEVGANNNFFITVNGGANRTIGYVRQRALRTEVSRGDSMQRKQTTQWTFTWADGVELLREDGLLELLAAAA